VVAELAEGLSHVQPEPLGELSLGLLDHDPAVQRGLKLLVQDVAAPHAALVQQADRGHVGQRLPDAHIGGVETARHARHASCRRRIIQVVPPPLRNGYTHRRSHPAYHG